MYGHHNLPGIKNEPRPEHVASVGHFLEIGLTHI